MSDDPYEFQWGVWGVFAVMFAALAVVAVMAYYWKEKNTVQCLACEIPRAPVVQYQPFFVDVPLACPRPALCSPTLICSACFADTDPCEVCRNLKDDPQPQGD